MRFMNMNKIISEYIAWKGTHAPSASKSYALWIKRFLLVCGIKKVEEYSINDIIKYHDWMMNRYSPYTVQYALVIIKNFFQYCRNQNYACLQPSLIRTKRYAPNSHRAIPEGEFRKITALIPTNEFRLLRDKIMIHLLWDTGVRVSELTDINLDQISETKRSAVIRTKKTNKMRIIVWSEETHDLLLKYLPIRRELHNTNRAKSLFVGWDKSRGWSIRLTTRSVQRIIKFYANKAGIKEKVSPHSFRHGWAHKRRDENASLAFIQRGLGHISPVSTFTYEQYCDVEFEKSANSYLKAV